MIATKPQLRKEIADLRRVGEQMANLCFNLGQNVPFDGDGRIVSDANLRAMYSLCQQWDAVKRSEPKG